MLSNKKTSIGTAALAVALATCSTAAFGQIDTTTVDDTTVVPYAGNIDPFGGNIDPFGGNIDPFGRSLDPFGGNLDPFGGNIDPFRGNLDPFKGNIDPFTGGPTLTVASVGQFWNDFGTTWKTASAQWTSLAASPTDTARQNALVASMQQLFQHSEQMWGARVQAKTGKTFTAGYGKDLLAKYGVSLSDPASFAKLTQSQRTKLAFEWYDGLQTFAGVDHVDHWMSAVNWNPNLTKVQGSGSRSIIGLLDSTVGIDADLQSNIVGTGGYTSAVNGHGSAVLSLIVADHDKKGVMGIAPQAQVIAYNPFDATNTASWAHATAGIIRLKQSNASVINMSLGSKGSTLSSGWNAVFSNATVKTKAANTVYVIAAGNQGISQTKNTEWKSVGTSVPSIIIVGSVDANNTISSFSNRPGTACILYSGTTCTAGNKLADRFIVAPGELLLAADGNGGLTRVSGTSFAAPLVSGAITLLHNRWPWLTSKPKETTDIILSSARDLGAPGTDAVYGRGMLDVEASQAPLNFATLQYYTVKSTDGSWVSTTLDQVKAATGSTTWDANGAYYYAYEYIGSTYRDFAMPLATRLVDQTTSINGSVEYFQGYVTSRLNDWIDGTSAFSDVSRVETPTLSGWKLGFDVVAPTYRVNSKRAISSLPSPNVRMSDPSGRFGFNLGTGNGARILGDQKGFGLSSDYEVARGGVNPVLGLASGGTFMNADVAVAKNVRLAVGFTENRQAAENNIALSQAQRQSLQGLQAYRAKAVTVRFETKPAAGVTVTADYAKVRESNGLLGVQSLNEDDFGRGASTQTATVGATVELPGKVTFAGSATAASTKTARGANQSLATVGNGVMSSAFALSVAKQGLFGKRDMVRLAVSQPLKVESGALALNSVEVIDRATGELGNVERTFDISKTSRRLTSELLYAAPLMKSGEVGLFGRLDMNVNPSNGRKVDGMVIGGRVSLPF